MAITTSGGIFHIRSWAVDTGNPTEQVQMRLEFQANATIQADSIGFVQVVRVMVGGKPTLLYPVWERRGIPVAEPYGGACVDCLNDDCNPVYGLFLENGWINGPALTQGTMDPNRGVLGRHLYGGGIETVYAALYDYPRMPLGSGDCSMIFETAALVLAGPDQGYYLGAIRWGWRRTGQTIQLRGPERLSNASPYEASPMFKRAVERWNAADGLKLPPPQ